MNNKYIASLLCTIALAFAPACCKKQQKFTPKEDVQVRIELDNTVFELEEKESNDTNVVKF